MMTGRRNTPLEAQQQQRISILVKQMGTNFLAHSILSMLISFLQVLASYLLLQRTVSECNSYFNTFA